MKRIFTGIIAGLIFGVILYFTVGSSEFMISSAVLGAIIGFVGTKSTGFGIVGLGALVGAIVYAVSALIFASPSLSLILQDAVFGAIIGAIIGLIIKFVPISTKEA